MSKPAIQQRFVALFCALILLALASCSEDPSSAGSDLFPPGVRLDSVVVYARSSSTYRAPITGNSHTLLLGQYQRIECRMLLQFGPLNLAISDTSILAATVKLRRRYWFRDSLGTLAFTVHKLSDSLSLSLWNENTIKFSETEALYEPTILGEYSKTMSPTDTFVTFNLDTALIRGWLRDGLSYPRGILLKPTPASTIVYGFTSIYTLYEDIRPELILRYRSGDSSTIYTVQEAFVATGDSVGTLPEHVIMQSGLADRGLLRFDVSGIPRSASITDARIEFVRDLTMSVRNEFSVDSVLVQLLLDEGSPPTGGVSTVARGETEGDTLFQADAKPIVQYWATGKPNYGVALRAMGEITTLDRFAVFGAGSIHRPRLRIVYSVLR